jgi:hypothetical protein
MISSPNGKTRARIYRYFVKPKLNTTNSPQLRPPPLRQQGKTSSLYLFYALAHQSCCLKSVELFFPSKKYSFTK